MSETSTIRLCGDAQLSHSSHTESPGAAEFFFLALSLCRSAHGRFDVFITSARLIHRDPFLEVMESGIDGHLNFKSRFQSRHFHPQAKRFKPFHSQTMESKCVTANISILSPRHTIEPSN
jgi:hypothetical protein